MKRLIRICQQLCCIFIIFFVVIGFSSCAGTGKAPPVISHSTGVVLKPIILPKPETDGGKPLMQALKERKTIRSFSTEKLPEQVLSNLLWAAFGINRPETGKRTAPSAVNWQEVDIYVALEKGLYIYEPEEHVLNPVQARDLRAKTTQAFQPSKKSVENAPVTFIYVADFKRIDGVGRLMKDEDKALTANADTGFIGQNVYLFCASEGLGTVVRAMINKSELRVEMNLRPDQHIILCQTMGYPKGKAVEKVSSALANIPDGAYQGSAVFEEHDYELVVIVKGHRIADVKMLKIGDTEYDAKAKGVIKRVIDAQSIEVDAISGATTSSTAILMAIENALLDLDSQ